MSSGRSQKTTNCFTVTLRVAALIILALAVGSTAWGQGGTSMSTGPLRFVTELPGQAIAIARDVAIVGEEGADGIVLRVFERRTDAPDAEHWDDVGVLTASGGVAGFGRSVATDGRTIVVGAAGAAYVFERDMDRVWREVAQLTSDVNTGSFGSPVSVSRTTVAVGAPTSDAPPLTCPRPGAFPGCISGSPGPGVVFVFERQPGKQAVWAEATRLNLGWTCDERCLEFGRWDFFGRSLSVDGNTLVVGAQTVRTDCIAGEAHIYTREVADSNAWVAEATLLGGGLGCPTPDRSWAPRVSVSGDTVVSGVESNLGGPALIYQRNQGGPKAWGQVVGLPWPSFSPGVWWGPAGLGISGDLAVVSWRHAFLGGPTGPLDPVTTVFSRNQGGPDAWGEIASFDVSLSSASVRHDTVLIGDPAGVYVLDTDGDGLRDRLDPCPRDPLNNVAESCQRASAVHPALDELIVQGEVTSETRGRRQIITAAFTNTSETAVQNPFFEVTELTGGNLLLNADAGTGGLGATLSPDVGDGILSPGESMTVTFRIRLRTHDPFQFFVTFHGDRVP
jgi:hypothetical protein